jgi:putative transcriptional regulator
MKDERVLTVMKVERAKRDLTQGDLAAMAGVTRRSINAIETGRMIPSVLLALKIARALGVTVEDLFRLEPHNESRPAAAVQASGSQGMRRG